jgi:glyoxylase-like metal-dependent hydrolase (beta-lactamase superfamily II)
MKQLAEDVYMLKGFPPNAINVYVAGEVLIDSATRQAEKRIFKQIAGRKLTAHALTHVHPDHQGCSHVVCERLGIPLWVGQDDVPAMETVGSVVGTKVPAWTKRIQERYWVGPPHPVSRALREGDEVAGFTVLDTPGHTRGHVSFWRESDRVLILGDVINNMNLITGIPGLNEPPALFAVDPAQNRASIRRLAALRPALAMFGHGAPLRDPDKLADFAAQLPA